jgi:DNA-binding ferritin-like protein
MMHKVLDIYEKNKDVVTVDLLTEYIRIRQKYVWFLEASLA